MGQVTVFSGPERRATVEARERLQVFVRGEFAPGVRVADVCRRHDITKG